MAIMAYGEFALQIPAQSQRADRILGCQLETDRSGRPDQVRVQYFSTGGVETVQMDFVEALALLSFLKSMQLDSGVSFPDDPRGPR